MKTFIEKTRRQLQVRKPKAHAIKRLISLMLRLCLMIIITPYVIAPFYNGLTPLSTPMMYQRLQGQTYQQSFINLDQMGKTVTHLAILSEDDTFCENYGINLTQTEKVVNEFLAGERARGASTITMQLSKNLFLWTSRSYIRKGLELPLALWLNIVLPKPRVLELYLNIAQFGSSVYGVEAAAQHYFKKSAKHLTKWQAALIITSLPSPSKRSPNNPSAKHTKLAKNLLKRFEREKIITSCLTQA